MRHDSGSLSEYTLETTEGISESVATDGKSWTGRSFSWSVDTGSGISLSAFLPVYDTDKFKLLKTSSGTTIDSFDVFTVDSFPINAKVISSSNNNTIAMACEYSGLTSSGQKLVSINADLDVEATGDVPTDVRFGDMAYLGDRFIYMAKSEASTNKPIKIFYSDILDPTVIDSLSYFSDISQPTRTTGIHVLNNRLYVFSEEGYSVWSNTPDVNLPFIIQKGSSGSVGLLNSDAKTELGGTLYFAGVSDGTTSLYSLSPSGISKLGNDAIENDLSQEDSITAFSFRHSNRDFICLNGEQTICYDISTGEFHKRSIFDRGFNKEVAWPIKDSETIGDKNIVFGQYDLDYSEVIISKFDKSIGTELGATINRKLVTSPFNSNGASNLVRELAFQTSVDYSSGAPVSLPSLELSVSKNFGYDYGTVKTQEFDSNGDHGKILRFMNIGFFRQAFVFKLETSTIYPHNILKMLVRLEKGFRQI